jgi:hypothetical protein
MAFRGEHPQARLRDDVARIRGAAATFIVRVVASHRVQKIAVIVPNQALSARIAATGQVNEMRFGTGIA